MKKKYIIYTVVIIAVILGAYFLFFRGNDSNSYEFAVAERGDIRQEVGVTGKVKPSSKVDLAFESGGKIASVFVDVGDKVYVGQQLAALNNSQYQAQYAQAQAQLEVEKTRLKDLEEGTRSEEILIQQVRVQNAEQSLSDAKNSLVDKIKDSYTKSDDAIRNQTDQLFINPRSTNPQLIFNTSSGLEIDIESKRMAIESTLTSWSTSLLNDQNIFSNLSNYANIAKQNLSEINYYLDKVALAVNGMSANSNFSQTTIDGYKSDVNIARTSVNTAIANISASDEKLRTAESTLSLARQELVLKEAGATEGQIAEQKSKVKSAEANVNNYSALIGKTIIYSPIKGIVTKREVEVGEIIQPNALAFSVISEAQFEIETNVPEADVAKIKTNDTAEVTLDAYEDDTIFMAKIVSIEPAETIIDGVSTYKTILQFVEKDDRIKSGMTANIDILTGVRENVISIPARAIHSNGRKYAEVLVGEEIVEREIETGLRSTSGSIEIISGLEEGDKVITSK
ncbi:hypothetical protein A2442_03905 [Candidatus Campbellbacteria bacterium RIFOXYC2_FULL_35_25]|uniref:Multidrug resistance protein MdtA-like barrel-sandwich hybrid domain-containing protein n=1 Tax=Candidatus Campbellbacteria bacterium RIFOXYC2_FULL_35_25 TaxID=1797582 RepID=A0A1F5EJT1_9BACT|nr:MAG: hypothetical protein A2442_03905 [Candidatus Campbellbacteria bacterium RIFOXYC2_FULL_35_25]